ncbi:hypothetical protein CEXT_792821 [Caerostris extrusa]|uniref:Secreted protein n=1 Tax=Caerostris extrusa TaxID=172846 RepID=A0AAV4MJI1_CAEEX|nr:hypothetical protein CEXT_792821 [Caerostris extrusa]
MSDQLFRRPEESRPLLTKLVFLFFLVCFLFSGIGRVKRGDPMARLLPCAQCSLICLCGWSLSALNHPTPHRLFTPERRCIRVSPIVSYRHDWDLDISG